MSIESALRRHTDQDWPEPWKCYDYIIPVVDDDDDDDAGSSSEWNIVYFPTHRRRLGESIAALPQRLNSYIELRRLSDEWKAATLFMSSTQDMFLHPAYQQIIGFGERALPFLIDELRSSDDYWFWALRMITRTDPVSDDQNGNYRAMKQAWLDWAAANNL